MRYLFITLLFIGTGAAAQSDDNTVLAEYVKQYQCARFFASQNEIQAMMHTKDAQDLWLRGRRVKAMKMARIARAETEDSWARSQEMKIYFILIIQTLCPYLIVK